MFFIGYELNVTGDCSSQGVGIISILPSGGTPPYVVEWINPVLPPTETILGTSLEESLEVQAVSPSVRTGLYPGIYQINITDSAQPTNNQILVNAYVSSGFCTSILSVSATTCGLNNGSVTPSATTAASAVQFNVYNTGNTLVDFIDTQNGEFQIGDLSGGTYYIVAIDSGGCSARTSNFIVLDSSPLDFGFYTVPNSACLPTGEAIGKIYVTGQTGTPPYTYLWSNNATGSTITGLTTGVYSCTVTDSNGCSTTKNTEVTNVPTLGLVYFSAYTPTCFEANGALEIFISGGTAPYYYSASTGNVDISYAQNFTISNIPSGDYGFVVTDAGLCQLYAASNLQAPNSIGSIFVNATNSTCSSTNGSIAVNVGQGTPPFTYTLVYPDSSNDSTTISLPNYTFNNLYQGSYTVLVEDDSSCVFSQVVNIFTSNLFEIFTSTTGSTCGLNNGSIYVEMTTGGTAPFTYAVDNVNVVPNSSLTSYTYSNISQGSHVISVTDANGCQQSQTVFVNGTPQMEFSLFAVGCGNGSEGSITALISSGTPPFVYTWSNNVAGNPQSITANNLTGGTYNLTITDANGCSLERSTTISCSAVNSGYVPFEVGTEELVVTVESEMGMLEMLNDGFQDLTNGNPNCILNSATFIASVSVTPVGLYLQDVFYSGSTLVDVPASNLWYSAVENLLIAVPGVQSVNINPLTNQITITKSPTNPYLSGQIINISIAIEYDISC